MNKQFSIDSFLDWEGLHWDFSSRLHLRRSRYVLRLQFLTPNHRTRYFNIPCQKQSVVSHCLKIPLTICQNLSFGMKWCSKNISIKKVFSVLFLLPRHNFAKKKGCALKYLQARSIKYFVVYLSAQHLCTYKGWNAVGFQSGTFLSPIITSKEFLITFFL